MLSQGRLPGHPGFETFEVISALSKEAAASLEKETGPFWLVPLKVGDFGIIHTGGKNNNSLDDGNLIDYPIVQLLRRTDKGIKAGYGTTLLEGRAGLCQVPLENIRLGASLTGPGRVSLMQDAMYPPRLLFNTVFKNFDCYIDFLQVTGPRDVWIRTKAPPTDGPAIWSFRIQRKLKHNHRRKLDHSLRVQLFHTQWSKDSKISLFELSVPTQGTPLEHGTTVNVIIEITIDPNLEHPRSYLQLSRIGPFDSWSQAFRVGIRIEFQDGGEDWKTLYLHSTRYCCVIPWYKSLKVEDLGKELNHIDLSWLYCMKTLATLLNWRWKPKNDPVRDNLTRVVWAPYRIRLLTIHFKFHDQCLVIDEPQPVEMQCPRLLAPF
ncbi:hypothetical protein FMEXI_8741 [Fusarium mexicanum]|uniref:Uncharacterized protein n=1 Tax=Fusarium mexicanum TaxID=751941 RepID=A0A8H5IPV6_9HYPO|nr:hypothetical protein FMEXI_8741 [Fusarium mexicanum]